MTRTLKASRVRSIQYHFDDCDNLPTTNINDYIAEFLDTTDVGELISKLWVIDEKQLGKLEMKTLILISDARKRVMVSFN